MTPVGAQQWDGHVFVCVRQGAVHSGWGRLGTRVGGRGGTLLLVDGSLFCRALLAGGLRMPCGLFKHKPAISSPQDKVDEAKELEEREKEREGKKHGQETHTYTCLCVLSG